MTERIGYVVTDGVSMNPVYYQGDLVVVMRADSYRVGQITAYHGDVPGQRVLHRIIGGNGIAGFVMKGDNNESIDPLTPTTEQMIGRAVLHVPHGGSWLRPLLGPSGLGMLSFFVVSGGVASVRTRRDIPRGRRKKKVGAMSSGSGGSWKTVAAILHGLQRLPPVLRVAATASVAVALLALVVGILGWSKPILETRAAPKAPGQSISYSYSAKVPRSAAYDVTTVESPEPIFRKLVDQVALNIRYDGPAGTFRLSAAVTNGTGWHTTMVLVPKTEFTSDQFDATIPLDLATFVARADAASRAIGTPASGQVTITLSAQVTSPQLADMIAPLQLNVTPLQMTVTGGSALRTQTGGTVSSGILVPREIKIFGHSLTTASQARSYAILTLFGATSIAVVVLLASLRRLPLRTRAEIQRRYPKILVTVEPITTPPGELIVNVDDFSALVRLAERYGQMILTWSQPDADEFVVRDEGITYRYRVALDGQPNLRNVELGNRPSAGTHRRKASPRVP
ncbi:DUF5305 family protein [Actinoplanes couchii]|nr:DUF5305 family protein [Actinoplanes couchii]MDR6324108.1 hypothetical protein [Actinoplanes couchii]